MIYKMNFIFKWKKNFKIINKIKLFKLRINLMKNRKKLKDEKINQLKILTLKA